MLGINLCWESIYVLYMLLCFYRYRYSVDSIWTVTRATGFYQNCGISRLRVAADGTVPVRKSIHSKIGDQ